MFNTSKCHWIGQTYYGWFTIYWIKHNLKFCSIFHRTFTFIFYFSLLFCYLSLLLFLIRCDCMCVCACLCVCFWRNYHMSSSACLKYRIWCLFFHFTSCVHFFYLQKLFAFGAKREHERFWKVEFLENRKID